VVPGGEVGGAADSTCDLASTSPFSTYRDRLFAAVDRRRDSASTWPVCVAGAIRDAIGLAAADPIAARRLTFPASGRRNEDAGAFAAMVDDLAARLRHRAPPLPTPERTSRNLVRRLARQILHQLELHPEQPVTAIAPDLIVFALTPYVGLAEARRLADQPTETS
jgi:hypothetical protein